MRTLTACTTGIWWRSTEWDFKIGDSDWLFLQVAAAAMASSMAMATGAMPDYEHMDERKFRQQLQARNKKAAKNEKRSGEYLSKVDIARYKVTRFYFSTKCFSSR